MNKALEIEQSDEDVYEAFSDAVKALGGAKRVGKMLQPDKPIEAARQWLLHCLDPNRSEKLDLYQILFILREARKVGYHRAMEKIGAETLYEVKAITPQDEAADLNRRAIAMVGELGGIVSRLEKLQSADK